MYESMWSYNLNYFVLDLFSFEYVFHSHAIFSVLVQLVVMGFKIWNIPNWWTLSYVSITVCTVYINTIKDQIINFNNFFHERLDGKTI